MRVFIVLISVGIALAAPQGYDYQVQVDPSGENVFQVNPNQYQEFLQQYASQLENQPQPPRVVYQEQLAGEITQGTDAFAVDGNQLLYNAKQAVQFEQEQKGPSEEKAQIQTPINVVQSPQQPQTVSSQTVAPPQAHFIVKTRPQQQLSTPQAHFIVKTRAQPQPEADLQTTPAPKQVTFQKEFYYLSAPQEEYEFPADLDDQLAKLKKNLRVVFIKAPENNGLENAALQLAKQAANQQTAIYVLNKQHDASELADKFNSLQTTPQKPEVVFIKYRTPEEADHAQRVIQAQYEALDGPNHINRPDVGASHSFVGNTGNVDPRTSNAGVAEKSKITKPSSTYLPSATKK